MKTPLLSVSSQQFPNYYKNALFYLSETIRNSTLLQCAIYFSSSHLMKSEPKISEEKRSNTFSSSIMKLFSKIKVVDNPSESDDNGEGGKNDSIDKHMNNSSSFSSSSLTTYSINSSISAISLSPNQMKILNFILKYFYTYYYSVPPPHSQPLHTIHLEGCFILL
jgi:hypothetical protein